MSGNNLQKLSDEQLVDAFVTLAVQQDDAMLENVQSRVTKLFWEIERVKDELKARPGDQRIRLVSLFDHPNMHVRLKAAKATLVLVPEAARSQLEAIKESNWQPQAGDAGMALWTLERGIYKPS